MDFNDVAFRIMEEDLIPLGGEGGAIVGEGNVMVAKMPLEPFDIVSAKGDMPTFDRVDMAAILRRHIKVPFGKMHLHAALGGEFDLAVIAAVTGGVGSRELLRRDAVHLQDVDVEIMKPVDILRHIVDVMKFKFHVRVSRHQRVMHPAQSAPRSPSYPDVRHGGQRTGRAGRRSGPAVGGLGSAGIRPLHWLMDTAARDAALADFARRLMYGLMYRS